MSRSPIKVLLVDDSPIALLILQRLLSSVPELEVVGKASSGREALALIPQVQPDVICTDLHMGDMDGLELTEQVMATYPRPILAISVAVGPTESQTIYQLCASRGSGCLSKTTNGVACGLRARQKSPS